MALQIRSLKSVGRLCVRHSSNFASTPPAPPLLLKLRNDLKTAMKAKDTTRLNVLRAILAETTNASKTSNPLRTDMQLLALLRKRTAASKAAVEDFQSAKRTDLAEQEQAEVRVLEEYTGNVKTLGPDEIKLVVQEMGQKLREDGKTDQGSLLRSLIGSGGIFDGKPVENVEVVKAVKDYMAQ